MGNKFRTRAFFSATICLVLLQSQSEIRIGKFSYLVKKDWVFLKDESYRCNWLTFISRKGETQAGMLVDAKRNDTLFVSGSYKVERGRLVTKEVYHHRHTHEPDSIVRVFVPDLKGRLYLHSYSSYRDGILKK